MAKRIYSDQQRAEALAALDANAGDVSTTAKQLAIPRKTLENWSKGHVNGDVAKIGHEIRQTLAERLESVAHQLLDEIPKKLEKATLVQIGTTLGIAVDKMQVLRGLTPPNHGGVAVDVRTVVINQHPATTNLALAEPVSDDENIAQ